MAEHLWHELETSSERALQAVFQFDRHELA
jgi:hypothetical protein